MLLFFDIDGTLFDDERRMPASVRPALEQARQNGHSLFVNTGRTLCNMDRRLDGFPFDGWIMGCGTRILLRGKTLQAMEYDPDSSLKLLNLFRTLRMPAVYECDTAMYFDPEGAPHPAVPYFRRFAEDHGLARDITEGEKMQDDAEVSDDERRRRDLERKDQSERRHEKTEDLLERLKSEFEHDKEMRQIDRKREKNRLDDDKREWKRIEKAEKEKLAAEEADAKMLRKKQEEGRDEKKSGWLWW